MIAKGLESCESFNSLHIFFSKVFKAQRFFRYLNHGLKISARTLTRNRKEWGLRQCDLQKIDPLPLDPAVQASLISSHSQGLNTQEIQVQLSKETNTHVCCRTVKCYLKKLNLKLLVNDVESGKISLDKVYQAYSIPIPRQLVYNILKEVDPEGMTACLCKTFKHCVFLTYGPNHIWSCDGHDKSLECLFMSPITIHDTLDSETVDMAWQMYLSHQHGLINGRQLTIEEASKQMHFTNSTHKQRIESLWSQMMKQNNLSIIDNSLTQIENGIYDPDDTLHKLLFNPAWKLGWIFKIIIKSGETTPSQTQLLALHTLHTVLQNILAPLIDWFQYPLTASSSSSSVTIQKLKQEHITIGNVWLMYAAKCPAAFSTT
ncbi:hypothetical protein VP01_1559g6 [Puccinia sorghi]|uniref:Uncharacterized protein n=1 Tax=Puccinia sorghi TaxID=27349 RepID=A0A0L6VI06_9BASI|nr:hypothetical protein VP01_1559g6 [Puccinia sorghi]